MLNIEKFQNPTFMYDDEAQSKRQAELLSDNLCRISNEGLSFLGKASVRRCKFGPNASRLRAVQQLAVCEGKTTLFSSFKYFQVS